MRTATTSRSIWPALARTLTVAAALALASPSAALSDTLDDATELGITPESLVVSGFSSVDASVMLTRITAAINERASMADAHADLDVALAAYGAARSAWRDDPGDPALASSLSQAAGALADARAALASAQSILFDLVVEGFDSGKVAALEVCRVALGYIVPAAYMAIEHSASGWKNVECAVRAKARCDRTGEDLEEPHLTTLAQLDAEPAVQLAQSRLNNDLATMEAVFATFD